MIHLEPASVYNDRIAKKQAIALPDFDNKRRNLNGWFDQHRRKEKNSIYFFLLFFICAIPLHLSSA